MAAKMTVKITTKTANFRISLISASNGFEIYVKHRKNSINGSCAYGRVSFTKRQNLRPPSLKSPTAS